ncbi:hypothetical protein [Microbacterium sp. No. 7]|uniref:hypothetical protein n=1 Tax=Microbacterium sp. No. 7 TaxID=1714373 RepID=UPI0009E72F8A|nr:hypothetical protein [Microbacterium sp. No. 7]
MSEPITAPKSARLLRAAIWVAIGALIAAALVSVFWVLFDDDNGVVGRAFTTILLLAGFAGIAILESSLADRRPAWLALASMVTWVVALLVGAFLIWMPSDGAYRAVERTFDFVLIVLILQGALLHVRLFTRAYLRHRTTFTSIVTYVTIALVTILALMLIVPLIIDEFVDFRDMYWRVVVALAILAAVGTALVPLVNALFAPRRPRPVAAAPAVPQAWPTYADGRTPLPVLPDGTPDWNAYYTGQPTYAQALPPVPPAPPAAQLPPQPPLPPAPPAAPVPPASAPQPPAPGTMPGYPPAPPQ